MDFEPSSISNESEYKKNVVGTRKKSVTTILAVISLILSATLIVALGKTVSFFKDETARLSE